MIGLKILLYISETLRKYPVLAVLDRVCLENYQVPDSSYVIEKGTAIFIPMFGINYDPEPNEFDSDRFSD